MTRIKKIVVFALFAIQFFAATPVAKADIEWPTCWPCGR
jgi:hypothetical protein